MTCRLPAPWQDVYKRQEDGEAEQQHHVLEAGHQPEARILTVEGGRAFDGDLSQLIHISLSSSLPAAHLAIDVGSYQEAQEGDRRRDDDGVKNGHQEHQRIVAQRWAVVAGPGVTKVGRGVGVALLARHQQILLDARVGVIDSHDGVDAVAVVADSLVGRRVGVCLLYTSRCV